MNFFSSVCSAGVCPVCIAVFCLVLEIGTSKEDILGNNKFRSGSRLHCGIKTVWRPKSVKVGSFPVLS